MEVEIHKALHREASPYDSHPSPQERIRWVEALGATDASGVDERPAWSLFRSREEIERRMTGVVRRMLEDQLGIFLPSESAG